MKDSEISITREEKDLGVLITDNLKPSSQCAAAVNKKRFRQPTKMVHALRHLQYEMKTG